MLRVVDSTFEREDEGSPSSRGGGSNKLEDQYGRTLPEGANPTLQRFYLRDPMKMTKKAVASGIAAGTAAAVMTKDLTINVVDTAKDTTMDIASAGVDLGKSTVNLTIDAAKAGVDLAQDVGQAGLDVANKALDVVDQGLEGVGLGAVGNMVGDMTGATIAIGAGVAAGSVAVVKTAMDEVEELGDEMLDMLGLDGASKEDADALRYAEFVHMMRTGKLDNLFPGQNWRSGAKQLHNYRKAFDTADVDGDDTLEQGEFELVMDTLHMGHDLTPAEVRYCWDVLKSARSKASIAQNDNHLTFVEFIAGVQAVRKDDVLKGRLDLTRPCPWELLSLLIDTPVSERETKLLEKDLSAAEKVGLKMVSRMQIDMERTQIRRVLQEAVEGRLHYLSEDKIKRMQTVWNHNVLQALMVSFMSTGISSPAENLFSYWFRTDGLVDIDCLCYTRGCGANPGSAGIDQDELMPGDATIPGKTLLDGDCTDHIGGVLGGSGGDQPCHRTDVFTRDAFVATNGTEQMCVMGPNGLLDSVCPCDLSKVFSAGGGAGGGAGMAAHGCNATCLQQCGFVPAWGPYPGTEESGFWTEIAAGAAATGAAGVVVDGVAAPVFEPSSCFATTESLIWFWLPLVAVIILCAVLEFMALTYYGVMNSIQVAWALGYRLVPLNEDRAFVADSLVRGAMELGNPNNAVYGVDPESDLGPPGRGRKILAGLMWKGKIVVSGLGLKFLLGVMFPWESMIWVKPWMVMPADMFWCAIAAHVVIKQAQIRGVGVATVHEVFNEVMDELGTPQEDMRDIFKLQIARAIGVSIVKHGNMYPSMELLLRHAIQWLGMKTSPAVQRPGELDSEEKFRQDMEHLTEDEMVAVLSIHFLTIILDGDLSGEEHEMLERVFATVPDSVGQYSEIRISWTAMQFRDFVPITAEILKQAFQLEQYEVR
jgi:hypothetical protein